AAHSQLWADHEAKLTDCRVAETKVLEFEGHVLQLREEHAARAAAQQQSLQQLTLESDQLRAESENLQLTYASAEAKTLELRVEQEELRGEGQFHETRSLKAEAKAAELERSLQRCRMEQEQLQAACSEEQRLRQEAEDQCRRSVRQATDEMKQELRKLQEAQAAEQHTRAQSEQVQLVLESELQLLRKDQQEMLDGLREEQAALEEERKLRQLDHQQYTSQDGHLRGELHDARSENLAEREQRQEAEERYHYLLTETEKLRLDLRKIQKAGSDAKAARIEVAGKAQV
ncbi:unnamed protein product, partial [Polarella glacialis]